MFKPAHHSWSIATSGASSSSLPTHPSKKSASSAEGFREDDPARRLWSKSRSSPSLGEPLPRDGSITDRSRNDPVRECEGELELELEPLPLPPLSALRCRR